MGLSAAFGAITQPVVWVMRVTSLPSAQAVV
jgi:hypothetical protein